MPKKRRAKPKRKRRSKRGLPPIAVDKPAEAPRDLICPLCKGEMKRTANYPNLAPHYQCPECRVIFTWEGGEFVPCQSPELHVPIVWQRWNR